MNKILAISDNMALLIVFVVYFSRSLDIELVTMSRTTCKLLPYLVRILVQFPSWIHVLITYDRLIFLFYAKKNMLLSNRTRIALTVAAMMLLIALANFSNILFELRRSEKKSYKLLYENRSEKVYEEILERREVECTASVLVVSVRDVTTLMCRVFLPFILITVGNVLLVKKFMEKKDNLRRMSIIHEIKTETTSRGGSVGRKNNNYRTTREKQFIKSVIFIDFIFLLTILPLATVGQLDRYGHARPMNPKRLAVIKLTYNICIFVAMIASLSSFLVNFFFNKLFKNELKCLIRKLVKRK